MASAAAWSLAVGVACGLAVYAALRWLWPEIEAAAFANLIGLAVLGGMAATALLRRRRARRPPPAAPRGARRGAR